jgi:hypothetical protein
MALLDMLSAPLFKSDETGRTVMFPNGAMGRGYLMPDAAMEARMRKVLAWLMLGAIFAAVTVSMVMHVMFGNADQWTSQAWGVSGAGLAAVLIAYQLVKSRLVRGLEPSTTRMTIAEAYARQAAAMPRWCLWSLAIVGVVFTCSSAAMLGFGQSMADRAYGIVGLLLFGTVAAIYVRQLFRQA